MEPIIEIRNLSIDFKTNGGTLRAVDKVSMDIGRGEIVGMFWRISTKRNCGSAWRREHPRTRRWKVKSNGS